jgi:hypothetical protein
MNRDDFNRLYSWPAFWAFLSLCVAGYYLYQGYVLRHMTPMEAAAKQCMANGYAPQYQVDPYSRTLVLDGCSTATQYVSHQP